MALFLMATHGTDGDVLPFTRLGEALRGRGHDVALLTHAHYEARVRQAGLEFVAVDTMVEFERNLVDTAMLVDAEGPAQLREFFERNSLFDQFRLESRELVSRYRPGETVLVGRCASDMSVVLAAEVTGAPRASIALSPTQLLALGGAAATFQEMAAQGVDAIRAEFGLGPVGDWPTWLGTTDLLIGLWPRWFDLAGVMSPHGTRLTGFLLPDEDEDDTIPAAAAAVLSGPVAPILITGGTGRLLHRRFYELAVAACRDLGRPVLVVVRHRDLVPDPLPPGMTWVPRLPFRYVMPKVAVVVHHGGIGTLARALVSATPQVILAHDVDRPDNAQRLARRRAAEWLPVEEWDSAAAAELVARALGGSNQPPPGAIDPVAGVTAAADAVERLLTAAPRTPRQRPGIPTAQPLTRLTS